MCEKQISRGDIYYADLGTGIGSEQAGQRPVVVIQNNVGNHHSPTVIVAPITSKHKRLLPTHVPLPPMKGLEERSCILLEQVRTIDRGRLQRYVGVIPKYRRKRLNQALEISVGLNPKFL